jgi:hypothetical protein
LTRLEAAHHAKISVSGSMLRAGEDAHVTASLPTTLDVQLSNLGMKACRTSAQDAGRRTQDAASNMHLAPRPLPPRSAPKRDCEDLWPERLAHSAPPSAGHRGPTRPMATHRDPSRPHRGPALCYSLPSYTRSQPAPRLWRQRAIASAISPPPQPCRLPTRARAP